MQSTDSDPRPAILLIAHGSRRPEANQDLRHVADRLRERFPDRIIEVSYLELTQPTIPEGAEQCVLRGATEVRMLPYFLSAGAHVSRDLEEFRAAFKETHPTTEFILCPPLGLHPKLIDVLCERLTEGLGERGA